MFVVGMVMVQWGLREHAGIVAETTGGQRQKRARQKPCAFLW
jgi:hypothetical protein